MVLSRGSESGVAIGDDIQNGSFYEQRDEGGDEGVEAFQGPMLCAHSS